MATPLPNDVEVYHAVNLITLVPRTDKGREWIVAHLKPHGWQEGPLGAYYTDRSELANLLEWMEREGVKTEIINPGDA